MAPTYTITVINAIKSKPHVINTRADCINVRTNQKTEWTGLRAVITWLPVSNIPKRRGVKK